MLLVFQAGNQQKNSNFILIIILSKIEQLSTVVSIQKINLALQFLKQKNLHTIFGILQSYLADSLNENFLNIHLNLCSFVNIKRTEFTFYKERCNENRQNSSGNIFR
ncbi:hypothetical protein HZS_5983 [Henneguya salminicola]|nr:hypothetical protein HZS_5983 [Henneguya salminicola]